ncbi:MAG: DEAD/DEAH box helicase family protein [Aeriscardovia sp.]|nr:DEAD/DEAH box helicase family protein [Aeriscardovia sp.]
MLQEVKDLQNRAVTELYNKAHSPKLNLTFSAPTGSGKTRMMADFMNRILAEHAVQEDLIFLVSTLSKSGLPLQSYNSFIESRDSGDAPLLEPYLISSDATGEGDPFIPLDYNVYILPTNLYRDGAILKDRGIFQNFLETMTSRFFGEGLGKTIYLIRDEGHVATNNLDEKAKYFSRVFNFSATASKPYDVEISETEAVNAKLIKTVKFESDPSFTLDDALDKFLEIREEYNDLLNTHPCMIIQISNAKKAEEQMKKIIMPALNRHQSIKWMSIVDTYNKNGDLDKKKEKLFDTNDQIKTKLPASQWREYARKKDSTIDVIIFKMVISEGWDIPRACMLYQVRDTTSERLDKQVLGRVRRNPRLLDFDKLTSDRARDLASTAWVWGLRKKDDESESIPVRLWKVGSLDVAEHMRVSTTCLETLKDKKNFKTEEFMQEQKSVDNHTDIFTLYRKLNAGENELQDLCYDYAKNNIQRWWNLMECYDKLKNRYVTQISNYRESMKPYKETSLPSISLYQKTGNLQDIEDWLWIHKEEEDGMEFSFDSEAEREWAIFLADNCDDFCSSLIATNGEKKYLWGKNYPYESEIHYEYYHDGLHKSYPDFVMKDKKGNIHIFEVKSLKGTSNVHFDPEEYKKKIEKLRECYLHCSRLLPNHYFYIPEKVDAGWHIYNYHDGKEGEPCNKRELRNVLRELNA